MANVRVAVVVGSNCRDFHQPQACPRAREARGGRIGLRFRRHRRSAAIQPGSRRRVARQRRAVQIGNRRGGRAAVRDAGAQSLDSGTAQECGRLGARPYGQNSWSGKPAAITGTSPGAIGAALAQNHLRQVLGTLGVLVMGGEAYVSFKPDLLDAGETITDANTRGFLKAFIDRFASLAARLSVPQKAAA